MTNLLFFLFLLRGCPAPAADAATFAQLMEDFDQGYATLEIPDLDYDYRAAMDAIPPLVHINRQLAFFKKMQSELAAFNREKLITNERLQYDHLEFEIKLNQERLALEKAWRETPPTAVPADGMGKLPKGWYQYRIHTFTSVYISPEELFDFGKKEVARVKGEISRIQAALGYANDSADFYKKLQSDEFVLTDKSEVLRRYEEIKSVAYAHLGKLFLDTDVPDIAFMEWEGADRFTPPGRYNSVDNNPYGTAVFHFNFYGNRHNSRVMDWMFMHEAVPGHHYQWSMREKLPVQPAFKRHFYYPGNFEGWAAYVEYLGKDMGLYRDPYTELGKWEWDLVRSTRILIDVGIHHFGWSKEEAIACWKEHIPGQDDIAEREVVRCTNWPAQALSYKVGAWKIQQMADDLKKKNPENFSLPAFHSAFLRTGQTPMEAVVKNIEGFMEG